MTPDLALDALARLGVWSVDALWLPLALWTLFALALYLADARLPLRRPLVRQRLLVAALVALPLGIALRAAHPTGAPLPVAPLLGYLQLGEITVTADGGIVAPDTPVFLPEQRPLPAPPAAPVVLGVLTLLLLGGAGVGYGMLALRHVQLYRWLRALPRVALPDREARAQVVAASMGVPRLRVRHVGARVSPFTYGWLRPVVVLPHALADDRAAWTLALAHEVAHVRNRDARWHGLARAAAACVPWHPLARKLDAQAALRCEQAADAFVLGRFPTERRPYAHLLLRFGALPAPVAALSASVHHLNPRVHAMKHVLDLRQKGLVPALLLVCSLAFTLSLQAQDTPPPPPPPPVPATPPAPDVFVVAEQPPVLVGGLEAIQANLTYPESAKRAGVQGRVIVQFVVNAAGEVEDAFVVRGVGAGLDEEALRAVRAATFEAGKQRGQAVKVQMTLPVTFRLPGAPPLPSPADVLAPPSPPALGDEVFVVVEQMPELVGGLPALAQQVRYPQPAKDAGVEGRVIVKFVVAKDGSVQDAHIVRGIGSGADEEALRVVRAAEFRPGAQRGQAVNVQMTLPITFKLGAEQEIMGDASGIRLLDVQRTGQTITGRVIDGRTDKPLPAANVVVAGSQIGGATDSDGRFVLKGVGDGARLRVSFVGFEPITVPVEGTRALRATDVAEGYTLEPGVPNPFSKDQEVAFTVPTAGVAVLEVYNAIGQRVAVLFNGETVAGQRYRAVFSGDDREAGVYFYRLTHNGKTMTQSGTLAR